MRKLRRSSIPSDHTTKSCLHPKVVCVQSVAVRQVHGDGSILTTTTRQWKCAGCSATAVTEHWQHGSVLSGLGMLQNISGADGSSSKEPQLTNERGIANG